MTLQEFQLNYRCQFSSQVFANTTWIGITKVYKNADNKLIDSVKTSFDIYETDMWLTNSQAVTSLIPWNADKLIDQVKRMHLDYFSRRAPIEDFYPLDSTFDISSIL